MMGSTTRSLLRKIKQHRFTKLKALIAAHHGVMRAVVAEAAPLKEAPEEVR